MKSTGANESKKGVRILELILRGILIAIALLILCGTMYALVFLPGRKQTGAPSGPAQIMREGGRIFTGIGKIRTTTAGNPGAAVIITVAFPYEPDDTSFSEELASKVASFRTETGKYFNGFTPDELRLKTEDELREDLLVLYNGRLRLGFIDTLYITDYMIIE